MLLLIIISLLNNVNSVDIHCQFIYDDYYSLSSQYTCIAQNSLIITNKKTRIEGINGNHKYSETNDEVKGLSIQQKIIKYMPLNLAEYFMNVIAIRIKESKLKEIHQSDLKPFTLLQYLNLDSNNIEILEDGLFEFNPLLEVIWLEKNKIRSVGETTFSNLNKLNDLDLNKNICISRRTTHRAGLSDILQSVKKACDNVQATTTTSRTTSTPNDLADAIQKRPGSNNIVWIIVCIAIVLIIAIINIIVITKYCDKKTAAVKSIEPENC